MLIARPLRWEAWPCVLGLAFLVLAGILLAAPFPPWGREEAAWVAFVPALLVCHYIEWWRARPFLAGFVVGIVSFGAMFWWIGHVTILGTSALVAYLALYPAVWFWVMHRWFALAEGDLRIAAHLRWAIVGASVWVILEWARGWMLTGFGWNGVGVSLYRNIPLLQAASLGGVLLLSWLVVFVNLLGARLVVRWQGEFLKAGRRRPAWELLIGLLAVAIVFAYGLRRAFQPNPGPPLALRLACIQPNIPRTDDRDIREREIIARYLRLTHAAAGFDPQLLVWPETTTGLDPIAHTDYGEIIRAISEEEPFYLLFGAFDSEPGKFFNAAFLWQPRDSGHQVYRKNILVPFGEYVPLDDYLPFLRFIVPFSTDFSAADQPTLVRMDEPRLAIAPLLCFEDTLPGYVRRVATLDPDLLVNLTNDSWFRDSPGAEQHLANAVFRAVETNLPLVRCANTGVTCVVDNRGRPTFALADADNPGLRVGIEGFLPAEIYWSKGPPTPYQRWGDWIVTVSAIVCLLQGLALQRQAREAARLENQSELPG